jgi:hypothetical protein
LQKGNGINEGAVRRRCVYAGNLFAKKMGCVVACGGVTFSFFSNLFLLKKFRLGVIAGW